MIYIDADTLSSQRHNLLKLPTEQLLDKLLHLKFAMTKYMAD